MKKNLKFLAVFFTIIYFGFGYSNFVLASNYENCGARVSFDVSPKNIQSNQAASISGSLTATKLDNAIGYGGQCRAPSGEVVNEYNVALYDKTSSRELFLMKFPLPRSLSLSPPDSKTWPLPDYSGRTIIPQNLGITGTRMSLVAQVKIQDRADSKWYTLTESSPVELTIQSTQPEVTLDKQGVVLGGVFQVTVTNVPAGWKGSYTVNNGQSVSIPGVNFTITATKDRGFKESGANTIVFELQDASGQILGTKSVPITTSAPGQPTPSTTEPKTTDSKLSEELFNPLPTDNLTGTLLVIAQGFLAIVALWGVTFIIIGGFKLVMAQGNEEKYLEAKKTIVWAILGVVVAMLSFSIIAIVQNLIGATVPDPDATKNGVVENKSTGN